MSNILKSNELSASTAVRALIVTLTLSVAAFGCTTNQAYTAGEPVRATPAGGPMVPSLSTTPGSAGPAIPATMISAAVDPAVDAIAVLEANRGFQGVVLGPASPAPAGPVVGQNMSGQVISPSLYANPQLTVNSSISSSPIPALPSAPGDAGVIATGLPADLTSGATVRSSVGNAAVLPSGANANFGVTGVSNTTATGLTTITPAATSVASGTNVVVGTGLAAAPSSMSSVLATPTLGTSGRLNVDNTVVARTAATPVRVETTSGRVTVTNASATTTSSNP